MSAASDKFEREAFHGRMIGMFILPEVKAWTDGYRAWSRGANRRLDNPYKAGPLFNEWDDGFMLGRDEAIANVRKNQRLR